jgi:hypothetical protein
MLTWFLRNRLAAFGREYDYDVSYGYELLDADPAALRTFSKLMALGNYRKDAPRDAVYAVKLVATMAEDCGPCTQFGITMAEREGTAPEVLRAIVSGDVRVMPDDVSLAYQFAQAALAHDPAADELRDQIVARWGKRALITLCFALTAGRIFPTLKYAAGHGKACTRVKVAGTPIPVSHPQQVVG